jgi:hypothetical protein
MARRGVFKPPYAGARGLVEWAIDLWPYVNGKALLSGVKLKELEMADMLDVVHFFFEEDLKVSSEEEAQAKSQIRSVLYRDLYKQTYKYGVKGKGQSYNYSNDTYPSDGFLGKDETVPDPIKPPTKPFVPATDFNSDSPLPFGQIVDPPLGN